ncbi:Transcription factor bHLH121-like protein [Drosera capensis]
MDQHQSNNCSNSKPRGRHETEDKDPVAARKVQKADREKLRRDRLNEQFLELGKALDPDRPKNDKGTILTDTIQLLKDLTAQVNKLKAEYTTFSEEARELTQEKNELKEEKTTLKADIENLNNQYQQRLRVSYPWAPVDPSVLVGPHYSYPMPMAMRAAPMPMHPSMQPFAFFGNQNPGAVPNHCSTFVPYPGHANPPAEPPASQYASTSHISRKQDLRSKTPTGQRGRNYERSDESEDVATVLELKTPGSSGQESSSGGRKGKQSQRVVAADDRASSRNSSSLEPQESSSSSVDLVAESINGGPG